VTAGATQITDVHWVPYNGGYVEVLFDRFPAWGDWKCFSNGSEIPMEGGPGNVVIRPNGPLTSATGVYIGTAPWLTGLGDVHFPCHGTLQFEIPGKGLTNTFDFDLRPEGCRTAADDAALEGMANGGVEERTPGGWETETAIAISPEDLVGNWASDNADYRFELDEEGQLLLLNLTGDEVYTCTISGAELIARWEGIDWEAEIITDEEGNTARIVFGGAVVLLPAYDLDDVDIGDVSLNICNNIYKDLGTTPLAFPCLQERWFGLYGYNGPRHTGKSSEYNCDMGIEGELDAIRAYIQAAAKHGLNGMVLFQSELSRFTKAGPDYKEWLAEIIRYCQQSNLELIPALFCLTGYPVANDLDYAAAQQDTVTLVSRVTETTWPEGHELLELVPLSGSASELCDVVRRPGTPLILSNPKTGKTYTEGKDFICHREESVPCKAFRPGQECTPMWIEVPPESSIIEGQIVELVCYKVCCGGPDDKGYKKRAFACMSNYALYDYWYENAVALADFFRSNDVEISYVLLQTSEVRSGGGCSLCQHRIETGWTMAQILGDCITQQKLIVQDADVFGPDTEVVIWSDMLDPNMNARPGDYYQVQGGFDGSWNHIPKDLTILVWQGPQAGVRQ